MSISGDTPRENLTLTEADLAACRPLVAEGGHWTWASYLRYRAFHAAYHAGQAYSVRHIFGHKTTDN